MKMGRKKLKLQGFLRGEKKDGEKKEIQKKFKKSLKKVLRFSGF